MGATKSRCNAMTSKARPQGFETFADATKRRAQKIQILRRGNRDDQRLAAKFEQCRKGNRCRSGACDVCLRLYQLRLFRQTGPVLAARPHWTRASVVPAGFLLPLGELVNVELKALGEMIDKRLERSSLRRRPQSAAGCGAASPAVHFPGRPSQCWSPASATSPEKRPEMRVTRDGTRSHMREKCAWSGAGTLHRPF